MSCPPPKPHPTALRAPVWADQYRVEDYRNVNCRYYSQCVDVAVREDWEGFTCRKCALFRRDAAPGAASYAFDQPPDNGRP